MIKLTIDRFAGESSKQSVEIEIGTRLKTTGFEEGTKQISDTQKAINDLNKTGINIKSGSIESANKQLKYTQTFLKTLKENPTVDITGGLDKLKSFGLFDILPGNTQKLLETMSGAQANIQGDENYATIQKTLEVISELFGKISDKTKEIDNELGDVKDREKSVKDETNGIKINWDEVRKKLKESKGVVAELQKGFKSLNSVRLVSLYHSVRRVTTGLVEMVASAANYEESLNLYRMALGEYHTQATAWMAEISDKLMLDPAQVMQYTGAFFNLTKGLGTTSDAAFLMSKNLTQLTYDMASYLNISNEAAQAKIQSAITGQSRAIASVGVATQVASLQELAYSMGIKKKVSEMTQAEKTYLRYIQIMNQTKHMQGDLGKTMITPANAVRILKNQIALLGRAFGQVLTPIIMKTIPYIMALTSVLKKAATALAEFFGYKVTDVDYSITFEGIEDGIGSIEKLGDAASTAGEKAKNSLAPFDELNQITSSAGSSGSGGSSGGVSGGSVTSGLEKLLPDYDILKNYTDELSKRAEDLEGKVKAIALGVGGLIAVIKAFEFITFLGKLNDSLKSLSGGTLTLKKVWDGVGKYVAAAGLALVSYGLTLDAIKTKSEKLSEIEIFGSIISAASAGGMVGGPWAALAAAILSVVNAIDLSGQTIIDNKQLYEDHYGDIMRLVEKTKEYNKELNDMLEPIEKNKKSHLEQNQTYADLSKRLKEITDENGKVKKGFEGEAKVIVDKLNVGLGKNIELKNGQIQKYKDIIKEIDKTIEAKKREILYNSLEEKFATVLTNERKLSEAVEIATKARDKAKKAANDTTGKSPEVIAKEQEAFEKADKEYQIAVENYKNGVATKMQYEDAYLALSKGNYAELDKILADTSENQLKYTQEGLIKSTNEVKDGKLSAGLLGSWAKLAKDDSEAYNEGLNKIADEKTREKIIKNVNKINTPLRTEGEGSGNSFFQGFKSKLSEQLGLKEFKVFLTTGKLDTKSNIWKTVSDLYSNNPIKITLTIAKGIKKAFAALGIDVSGFATGGFPTSGDLFFANENGKAEYIASVGNKTAVANQDQMATVITNAVIAGFNKMQPQGQSNKPNNIAVYIGNDKVYQGQGQYQTRQTERYGTSYVKI